MSCNDKQTVMVKMSSSYRISQTREDRNPIICGMGILIINNHTSTSFSSRRLVEADLRNIVLFLMIQSKIPDLQNKILIEIYVELYGMRAFHCIFTRDSK